MIFLSLLTAAWKKSKDLLPLCLVCAGKPNRANKRGGLIEVMVVIALTGFYLHCDETLIRNLQVILPNHI